MAETGRKSRLTHNRKGCAMSHKLHTIILLAAAIACGNVPPVNYELIMAKSRLRMLLELVERAPKHRKRSIQNDIDVQRKIINSIARGK